VVTAREGLAALELALKVTETVHLGSFAPHPES
jgi:hypothetical protein